MCQPLFDSAQDVSQTGFVAQLAWGRSEVSVDADGPPKKEASLPNQRAVDDGLSAMSCVAAAFITGPIGS